MSLRLIEGENMRKGRFMEGMILLTAVIFMGLASYIYLKKDDTEAKRYADKANDAKLAVDALDVKILTYQDIVNQLVEKLRIENKAVENANMALLNDLNHRIAIVEKTQDTPKNVNVNFPEPIKVSVVYRQAEKKPLLPTIPSPHSGGSTGTEISKSLLQRAGVTQ